MIYITILLPPTTFASGALHFHNGCQIELRIRTGNLFFFTGDADALATYALATDGLTLVKKPKHFHFCDHFFLYNIHTQNLLYYLLTIIEIIIPYISNEWFHL